jgi:pilus assembly protein CpaB
VPDPVFVLAWFRRMLYRRAVRRGAVAVIVVATMATVATILYATEAARARWGDTRPVAVADRSLAPGEAIDREAVTLQDLPASLVPDEVLADEPIGAVVRYPIAAGEPLTTARLAPMGVAGTAALVPEGHRAVGLPTSQLGLPPLRPGDVVDVLVVLPPGDALDPAAEADSEHDQAPDSPSLGGAEPAFPLVTDAQVIDASDEVVTVSVPIQDAARVAYAVASGIVVLTLTGH